MTSRPRLSDAAAKVLREAPLSANRAPTRDEEARALAAVAQAIRGNATRRSRGRYAAGALVAAAAAVALVVGVRTRRGAPVVDPSAVVATSGAVILSGPKAPSHFDDGARAVADEGPGAFTLGTGTRMSLDKGGALSVIEQGAVQRYSLDRGAIRLDVAKLGTAQRFVLRTADAEIEVRGTSFHVAVMPDTAGCAPAATTHVEVFEGVVVVRAFGDEATLRAGDMWPQCHSVVAPSTASTPAPPRAAIGAPDEGAPAVATAARQTPRTPTPRAPGTAQRAAPPTSSALAAQNDLFSEAVTASRMGENTRAVALFDQFLAEYPGSSLAESATAQRMRLLGNGDAKRAAARAYLARYPSGFARADAEAILRSP